MAAMKTRLERVEATIKRRNQERRRQEEEEFTRFLRTIPDELLESWGELLSAILDADLTTAQRNRLQEQLTRVEDEMDELFQKWRQHA
jgi:5'-deoxynucleotidase YfbR-like HD superfamily hydrolase